MTGQSNMLLQNPPYTHQPHGSFSTQFLQLDYDTEYALQCMYTRITMKKGELKYLDIALQSRISKIVEPTTTPFSTATMLIFVSRNEMV